MTKLESAYIKAMGDINPTGPERNSADVPVKHPLAEKRSGSPLGIASARRQIAAMGAQPAYTAEESKARRLIHPQMEDQRLLNDYRILRTRLLSQHRGSNFITLVCSAASENLDDSWLVASNLAAAFALDEGKTSLLVEASVTNPCLHKQYGAENSVGLLDFLESEDMELDAILSATRVPRLRFISGGRPRELSEEYFTSERMIYFLSEIGSRYAERFPILAAPSIQNSADTRILVELCDCVVLVVPYGQCTEEDVRTAAETIGREKLAGVVLNDF